MNESSYAVVTFITCDHVALLRDFSFGFFPLFFSPIEIKPNKKPNSYGNPLHKKLKPKLTFNPILTFYPILNSSKYQREHA